jgi:hypothetical protein
METIAKPAKLKSGAWGARVEAPVKAGDTVTIRTAAGKSWQARVERVVWTDGYVSLCATQSLDRPASSRPTGERGICANCGDRCSPLYRTCYECSRGGASFYDAGRFVLGSDD